MLSRARSRAEVPHDHDRDPGPDPRAGSAQRSGRIGRLHRRGAFTGDLRSARRPLPRRCGRPVPMLAKDTAMDVFERLEAAAQADLITELADAEVVGVFEALDPDDVVGLLDERPATVTKRLLKSLSARQRAATPPILGPTQASIARRMSPAPTSARP